LVDGALELVVRARRGLRTSADIIAAQLASNFRGVFTFVATKGTGQSTAAGTAPLDGVGGLPAMFAFLTGEASASAAARAGKTFGGTEEAFGTVGVAFTGVEPFVGFAPLIAYLVFADAGTRVLAWRAIFIDETIGGRQTIAAVGERREQPTHQPRDVYAGVEFA